MEYVEEEQYILLKFNEKIEQAFFEKTNLYFKMVNLETGQPFVQIGNHVFRGKYEDGYLGTHLFFEELAEPRVPDIYSVKTAINLKYITKTPKVLKLDWQKIPDEVINVDQEEQADLEFIEKYDTVLKRIEHGNLDIRKVIKKPKPPEEEVNLILEEKIVEKTVETCESEAPELMEVEVSNSDEKQEKLSKNELVKEYILKPKTEPEYYEKNVENFKTDSEFFILKELYLKHLDYKVITLRVKETNINKLVDIASSISDGIITEKDVDTLTNEDKQALLSVNNFENFSLPTKLIFLIEHLKVEKTALLLMSKEELDKKDIYGRTPKKRYKLLKSLARDIEYYLFLCIREDQIKVK